MQTEVSSQSSTFAKIDPIAAISRFGFRELSVNLVYKCFLRKQVFCTTTIKVSDQWATGEGARAPVFDTNKIKNHGQFSLSESA